LLRRSPTQRFSADGSRAAYSLRATARLVCALALAGFAGPTLALDAAIALRQSQAVIGRPIGDFELTQSDGTRIRLSEFRGSPLVVSFVYTGCGQVCPTATRFLDRAVGEAERALGRSAFNVATIGFNVPLDNPEAMRNFARQQGIVRAQWKFLTPDVNSVDALTATFGFVYTRAAGGFDHVTQVTVVDAQGRIARQIYGDALEPRMLVTALRDVASGTAAPVSNVSELIERVRILCTVYDPLTGSYRLNYALFIELFAGLTVLGATAHYLLREWRRQRHARC
jgi:protein SCO1